MIAVMFWKKFLANCSQLIIRTAKGELSYTTDDQMQSNKHTRLEMGEDRCLACKASGCGCSWALLMEQGHPGSSSSSRRHLCEEVTVGVVTSPGSDSRGGSLAVGVSCAAGYAVLGPGCCGGTCHSNVNKNKEEHSEYFPPFLGVTGFTDS